MRLPNALVPFAPSIAPLSLCIFVFVAVDASAEIVFQDLFTQPAGSITNSSPWIDVEGNGWQSGGAPSQLVLDGAGHLYNSATNAGAAAGVQLIPIGPHGSLTASALMELPAGSTESIEMGFGSANGFLTATNSGSGPWVQVKGNGTMILYGGVGQNNPTTAANAFTNNGNPVEVFLTYDAFHATASAGTVNGGVSNLIFNELPVTNSTGLVSPDYLLFQLTTNLTTPTARWVAAVSVDWYPRPPPMIALPVSVASSNLVQVGSPGTNDIVLIQTALNKASNSTNAMEIRFTAGAMYVISNSLLAANTPLFLQHGTNRAGVHGGLQPAAVHPGRGNA
jgi:hypothetical protein